MKRLIYVSGCTAQCLLSLEKSSELRAILEDLLTMHSLISTFDPFAKVCLTAPEQKRKQWCELTH